MKNRIVIIVKFFQVHWEEISRAAAETVTLWGAVFGLAKKLADDLETTPEPKEEALDDAGAER